MSFSEYSQSVGLHPGAIAIENPVQTLYDRFSSNFCNHSKYSYSLSELITPLFRSIQALIFSLFTGTISQHVKLYGLTAEKTENRDCFYHTNNGVKAEPINEKYDRSYTFLNPDWEEIRKRYIGTKQFASTQEFADHAVQSISLFLKTAAEKSCRTNLIGITLTPLHRCISSKSAHLDHKRSFIGKLPDGSRCFSCTELTTRAFLFAGIDLFPETSPKGIYPRDFYESKCFQPLSPQVKSSSQEIIAN